MMSMKEERPMSQTMKQHICIFGAGSVGCYVGGRMAATGCAVTLIGRERLRLELMHSGLHLTDLLGADLRVKPDALCFVVDADAAADAELVMVTVKSADTAAAGRALAKVLKPGTVVVSFQNGMGNAGLLRDALQQQTVLSGMVQFNVLNRGGGHFHQGSEGTLEVEQHLAIEPFSAAFAGAGLPLKQHADMPPVQWAKLLLNLNNPINALSNLPLKAELSQLAFRTCLALAQDEALRLMGFAGIRPARLTPLPPNWIPGLLKVPTWLFRTVAKKMLAFDALARSSMWEDLEAGRITEVDWLNGEIVRLAEKMGRRAPVNARLIALIQEAEAGGKRDWAGKDLLNELKQAAQG
jgi:2-dehydropantoate 2-reductase